jgi:hypothetical protein
MSGWFVAKKDEVEYDEDDDCLNICFETIESGSQWIQIPLDIIFDAIKKQMRKNI